MNNEDEERIKLKSIEIHNIGIIGHFKEEINKPLTIFFGKPEQGKSTIIETLPLACGGTYSKDILKHGASEGFTHWIFNNASVKREFYLGKDGTIKDKPIKCVINGEISCVTELKKLLNPFLLDPNFYSNKSVLEKNRFFLKMFKVDLSMLNKEEKDLKDKAASLNANIKAYGEIDIEEVKQGESIDGLVAKKENINKEYDEKVKANNKVNGNIQEHNNKIVFHKNKINDICEEILSKKKEIELLGQQIKHLEANMDDISKWLIYNPQKSPLPAIPFPDHKEIDEQIRKSITQDGLYAQYQERIKKYKDKQKEEESLKILNKKILNNRADKLKKLAEANKTCNIAGLIFNEEGQATFDGFSLDMISKSQEIRLSKELESLYPPGLGIELVDGAESLGFHIGTNVQVFVDRAKSENKTILATVVSDSMAKLPDEVGVFIVKDGIAEKK